jgi:hypothetical protein
MFIETFDKLKEGLTLVSKELYTKPSVFLDNGTIGKHTRHIIELVQCLIIGYASGKVNYDKRERNLTIETDVDFAIECLNGCIAQINKADKKIMLAYEIGEKTITTTTTYFREIMYNIEHCTHHQALIKVAFNEFKISIDKNFGVATSTIKYRKQCVQLA